MTTRIVILFVGLLLVCAAMLLTFEQYLLPQHEEMAIEPGPECSSCTRRHQAYARSRKSQDKVRLTPIVGPDQQKPQSDRQ